MVNKSSADSQAEEWRNWQAINRNAPFAARDGAGLLSYKGRLWLLGGWNPADKRNFPHACNSEVWSSADGIGWTLVTKQAPWEGRHTAGYVVHDGKMWIVGGDCNQGHYQPDVWNSEDGINWTLVHDHVPWGQRALHHTAAFAGKIWVMGGQTMPLFAPSEPRSIVYNDVWCSEDGVHWERAVGHAAWGPRGMIGGSAVLNGRLWIMGGGTYDTPEFPQRKYFNDVWSTADGVNWECHAELCPWAARQYHEIAAFDGKLWVMEGYDGVHSEETNEALLARQRDRNGNRNDVWYSADGSEWHELPNTPWKPRHAASVVVHHEALWVIAGNNMTPDVWKLTVCKTGDGHVSVIS